MMSDDNVHTRRKICPWIMNLLSVRSHLQVVRIVGVEHCGADNEATSCCTSTDTKLENMQIEDVRCDPNC